MTEPTGGTAAKTEPKRRRKIVLAVVLTLVAWQVFSYLLWAEPTMPVAGLRNLADHGFLKSRKWIYLPAASLSPSQRRALGGEVRKFVPVVYENPADIPTGSILTDPGRPGLIAYRDGISFDWNTEWVVPFCMRGQANHYVSGTGAEWHDAMYLWLLGRWVKVWTFSRTMA